MYTTFAGAVTWIGTVVVTSIRGPGAADRCTRFIHRSAAPQLRPRKSDDVSESRVQKSDDVSEFDPTVRILIDDLSEQPTASRYPEEEWT